MSQGNGGRRTSARRRPEDPTERAERHGATRGPAQDEPFAGRVAELASLQVAWEQARRGRHSIVTVEGPAGLGKTALIRRFVEMAGRPRTIWAGGVEGERAIAYGLADRLFRSSGAAQDLLRGRASPTREGARLHVGLRLLERLEVVADAEPAVLVVDDAHCSDEPSLHALDFALRRLTTEAVLAVLVTPELGSLPPFLQRTITEAGARRIRLGPLGQDDILAVAAALGVAGFTTRAARRLAEHTLGSPLHARALLEELPASTWTGGRKPLPAPQSLQEVVQRRVARASEPARGLLEAAAVMGGRQPLSTVARVARVADPLEVLDEAVQAGLRAHGPGPDLAVEIAEPLVATAIVDRLPPARRRRLHLTVAGTVQDEVVALRHRVMAEPAPDAGRAAEAEAVARRQLEAGAWTGAAHAMLAASALSTSRQDRDRRLLEAVGWTLQAGDVAAAEGYAEQIRAMPPSPRRDAVLAHLATVTGRPEEAQRLLGSAWRAQQTSGDGVPGERDRPVAAGLAQLAAFHSLLRLDGDAIVRWARRAVELSGGDGQPPPTAILALGLGYAGRAQEGIALLGDERGGPGRPPAGTVRGQLRAMQDDLMRARADIADDVAIALRAESLGFAAYGLAHLAWVEYRLGEWDDASVHASRGLAIAVEMNRSHVLPLTVMAAVATSAARGHWTLASEHLQLVSGGGDYESRTAAVAIARALLATARLDHEAVADALEPLVTMGPASGVARPGAWSWKHLYADALLGLDRIEEARGVLRDADRLAAAHAVRSEQALLARARGRLEAARGEPEAAEAAFERSLTGLAALAMPFETALSLLAYGQFLRRTRRRTAAAGHLRAAHETLSRLGARPFVERCEQELVACGLEPVTREGLDPDHLTPQELAIARLVGTGLSNREVARQLLLSVKTVENHLTRVYAKLGVGSRTELALVVRNLTSAPV